MSSIISDLFYGSKRNILDHYLANRQDNHHPTPQRHSLTHIHSSFIEFVVKIPINKQTKKSSSLRVAVEMGNKQEQGFVEMKEGRKGSDVEIRLRFIQLQKDQLNKYINIKITISEGKYESKMIGYIPIETIKSMTNNNFNQKSLIIQMKGKKSLGFHSIHCSIILQIQNNNILNSELLNSVDKSSSYANKYKNKNMSEFSDNENMIRNINEQLNRKEVSRKRGVEEGKREVVITENYSYVKSDKYKRAKVVKRQESSLGSQIDIGKMREVTTVNISIVDINIKHHQINNNYHYAFIHETTSYQLHQNIALHHINQHGVQLQVEQQSTLIGFVHLNVFFLTSQITQAELPIYSPENTFIGTLTIQNNAQNIPIPQQSSLSLLKQQIILQQKEQRQQLMVISIEKIIFLTSFGLQQQQAYSDQQLYNFTKIESNNRLRVVVRVNNCLWQFDDLLIRCVVDVDEMKIVHLLRKDGFNVQYDGSQQEEIRLQIQVFSQLKLLSYAQIIINKETSFNHHFLIAHTNQPHAHAAIYLKTISLTSPIQYFASINHKSIFLILTHILHNQITLKTYCKEQIRQLINSYKQLTFIQISKIFALLQRQKEHLSAFQESKVYNVYEGNRREGRDQVVRLMVKLMKEFVYMDGGGSKEIEEEGFEKVMQFYGQEYGECMGGLMLEGSWIKCQNRILYPFFIGGFYWKEATVTVAPNQITRIHNQLNNQDKGEQLTKQKLIQQQQVVHNAKLVVEQRKKVLVECNCYVQKIQFDNIHLLHSNNTKIPNITLSITKKVVYSNNNPMFVIAKEIDILQPIKIYHKKVGSETLFLLGQLILQKRKTSYQLQASGRCKAKVTWGY